MNYKNLNIALKLGLLVCFIIVFLFDFDHLSGKGMEFRAPFFLGIIVLFPILSRVKNWKTYPHATDALITIPFLLDTLGNLFGLFDRITIFDDVIHAVNWVFVVMAFHAFRFQKNINSSIGLSKKENVLFGVSLGALLIVIWEVAEWVVSVDGMGYVSGLHLSYNDTIGDLAMSTVGGFLGSVFGVLLFDKKST